MIQTTSLKDTYWQFAYERQMIFGRRRKGMEFLYVDGRRLSAIDCQGLFCEVDKYLRLARPELKTNRSRMKARYRDSGRKVQYVLPHMWTIHT